MVMVCGSCNYFVPEHRNIRVWATWTVEICGLLYFCRWNIFYLFIFVFVFVLIWTLFTICVHTFRSHSSFRFHRFQFHFVWVNRKITISFDKYLFVNIRISIRFGLMLLMLLLRFFFSLKQMKIWESNVILSGINWFSMWWMGKWQIEVGFFFRWMVREIGPSFRIFRLCCRLKQFVQEQETYLSRVYSSFEMEKK